MAIRCIFEPGDRVTNELHKGVVVAVTDNLDHPLFIQWDEGAGFWRGFEGLRHVEDSQESEDV